MFTLLVLVSALVLGVLCGVGVNHLRKRKYAGILAEALDEAGWCGAMGHMFRAGEYDDILSVKDVLAVQKVYLAGIYEFGFSKGQDGIPDYVKFTEFHGRSWEAEEAYLKGHAAGTQICANTL